MFPMCLMEVEIVYTENMYFEIPDANFQSTDGLLIFKQHVSLK
jgi:hypothetical protein